MIMCMCKVICVTNRRLAERNTSSELWGSREVFLRQLQKTVRSGVDSVILREKDLCELEYEILAGEVKEICDREQVPLTIHTYVNVAKRLGIRRIHLPFHSLVGLSREEKEYFEVLGASVHAWEEAVEAEKAGASYVTAGHVFVTDCKKGLAPRGLDFLENVCREVKIPVYAIGGINAENAGDCVKAGAAGVCLMSSLMQAEEPGEIIENIRR